VLLDGAHNPAGIAALVGHLAERPIRPRPVLLFGTTREKDLDLVLAPLLPHVDGLVAGRAGIDRAMDPAIIVEWARARAPWVVAETDPGTALARARLQAGEDGAVLVTGSLYLVGDVLTALDATGAPGPVAM
jgi:dihydrofolate synthase/folylpolyglutamate synthase